MEAWAGDEKVVMMHVKLGDELYAGELLKFMHTQRVPYSAGSDIVKLLLLAHEYLVPVCQTQCIHLLKEVSVHFFDSCLEIHV